MVYARTTPGSIKSLNEAAKKAGLHPLYMPRKSSTSARHYIRLQLAIHDQAFEENLFDGVKAITEFLRMIEEFERLVNRR